MTTQIADNIRTIRNRMAAAAARAGRDPAGIRLMAGSKTVEPERIRPAIAARSNAMPLVSQ